VDAPKDAALFEREKGGKKDMGQTAEEYTYIDGGRKGTKRQRGRERERESKTDTDID
jgi:hypothetical protein